MKLTKKVVLVLLLPLFAFAVAHKFYVSVTNITYSDKDDALQITTRIFIDDLENVLAERYGIATDLATDKEYQATDKYIEKYLKAKFALKINRKTVDFDYLGKEYDNDVVICYIEVPKVGFSTIQSIEVTNEVLMDLFDEQQNVVHFKLNGNKKSFVLVRENNKGMLNL
ncbi:MAG: DUF6702 family protein [Bacteroidota bacterium]